MYLWFFSLSAFILVTWIPGGKTALITPDNSHWVCVLAAKSPQNYILPHPDCTKFHVCQYLGGTRHSAKSWKAHIFNCPATTGFDELLKVCNHLYNLKQENGRCASTTSTTLPPIPTPTTPAVDTTLPPLPTDPPVVTTLAPVCKNERERCGFQATNPPINYGECCENLTCKISGLFGGIGRCRADLDTTVAPTLPPTTTDAPTLPPTTTAPPVDCVLSVWGSWSTCTKSCGTGTTVRRRKIEVEQENGGEVCQETKEMIECNTDSCPVDCRLTIWSSWSACTKSCGTGTTARTREIESEPENGGEECGDTKEMVECNTSLCPVWSEWSDFTDCSETCTGGVQTRTRTCSLPDECEGDKRDVQECPIIEGSGYSVDLRGENDQADCEYCDGTEGSGLPPCDISDVAEDPTRTKPVDSTVCKTTEDKTTSLGGEAYEVPDQNVECVFPFSFEGEVYSKCTNEFACETCFWCGTTYNVTDATGWGLCNEFCPTEDANKGDTGIETTTANVQLETTTNVEFENIENLVETFNIDIRKR